MSARELLAPRPHPASPHLLPPAGGSRQLNGSSVREGGEKMQTFESSRLLFTFRRESHLSEKELLKASHKVITTDESNGFESHLHESILVSENRSPNQEYFQPLAFKQKRTRKAVHGKREGEVVGSRLDLSEQVRRLRKLVHSQDSEMRRLRQSLSERELRRLVKIHSIEKLKLLEEIQHCPELKRKLV